MDARSATELRYALELILPSPSMRQRLAACGRIHAERLRWERCAEESLEFPESVRG